MPSNRESLGTLMMIFSCIIRLLLVTIQTSIVHTLLESKDGDLDYFGVYFDTNAVGDACTKH